MSEESICPHCGEPQLAGSYYCASCGKAVAPSNRPGPARQRTMVMGAVLDLTPPAAAAPLSPADDPGRSTAAGIAEPPRGQAGRTMAGISPPPPANPLTNPAGGVATDRKFARTMVGAAGMTLPMPGGQAPAAEAQAEPANASRQFARTMVGAGSGFAATEASLPPPGPESSAPPPSPSWVRRSSAARTRLGLERHGARP